MKWPFVRRSKYELLENGLNIVKEGYDRFLVEINRLNQELANELNSHRETKEHEQKLFEAHDKLNQQNMGLLFEVEQWKEAANFWMGKAARAKSEISKVRGTLRQIAKKL